MHSLSWLCLYLILLLASLTACDNSQQEIQDSASPSSLQFVVPGDNPGLDQLVVASGTLKPVGEVEVGSEVSGRITELLVDFNDVVQQGQIIARIDSEFFEAQLRQAKATLLNAKATVEMRKASLRQSSRSLERIRILNKKNVASENLLDEAETEVWVARAELDRAKAFVRSHEAALEEAKVTLSRTAIRAPIDGVVISREVMSGQTVAASLEAPKLFKIARTLGEMEIHARVDEADIGQLQVGQQAIFTVPAYGEQRFSAKVIQIRVSPKIIDNVVTYTVVLLAENQGDSLLPGMTAVVEIAAGQAANNEVDRYSSRIEQPSSVTSR
ncbi:efflux RND transporter periplasmic adaptor subunit [Photobacterium sp. OFAV2-7]|uniref:efflux RND transporter periplasmic adaptor subunit n=1 Tax=Photobacterium sp. OFAV2-7 TaxID=2917748 RepID=UPI001EF5EE69|nr:efflux RND transporter periplasmic adaptor subunit [Photobacterium sp. OFAV2-7]MCG7587841.1 efflux RND transporter periplasmic adaptor subunit [Photobacterium sp. OFAV2-7]